jgi:phosphatidylglycerophosphatase A
VKPPTNEAQAHDEGAPRLHPSSFADPAVFLATGFASGFLRPAPGTWGSLVALVIWWVLLAGLAWHWQLAVVVATVAVGTWVTHVVARRYGVHDDPRIVIDEFAGLWLALLGAPATLLAGLAGFVLFRLLDIAKVWPVGWADRRVSGAVGVMLDDLLAGGIALGVLQLAFYFLAWPAADGSL